MPKTPPPGRRVRRAHAPQHGQGKKPQKKIDPSKHYFDVEIRAGLDVELVRMNVESFGKLQTFWAVAKEDVIIRIRYPTYEKNMILRGSSNGTLIIRNENAQTKIPPAMVILNAELLEQMKKDAESKMRKDAESKKT